MIRFTQISTMKNILNDKIIKFYLHQVSFTSDKDLLFNNTVLLEAKNFGGKERDRCLRGTKFNRKKDFDMYIQYCYIPRLSLN